MVKYSCLVTKHRIQSASAYHTLKKARNIISASSRGLGQRNAIPVLSVFETVGNRRSLLASILLGTVCGHHHESAPCSLSKSPRRVFNAGVHAKVKFVGFGLITILDDRQLKTI